MSRRLFTSESVTEGHPDKIADQISDAVLDRILVGDPKARVACETLVTTGLAMVAGEITTGTHVEIPELVRGVLRRIGYTKSEYGIDADTCAVLTTLDEIEGYCATEPESSLYTRTEAPVAMTDGRGLNAWVYLYNAPLGRAQRIESGDYLLHLKIR